MEIRRRGHYFPRKQNNTALCAVREILVAAALQNSICITSCHRKLMPSLNLKHMGLIAGNCISALQIQTLSEQFVPLPLAVFGDHGRQIWKHHPV